MPHDKVTVPGQRMVQGGRTVYVLTPSVSQLLQIVPERVNPDVIQDANRRLYIPHGKSFGDYLLATEHWVSGALLTRPLKSALGSNAGGFSLSEIF